MTSFCDRMRAPRMYCQSRSCFSSSSIVSLLIMPRSATMQTLVTPKPATEPIDDLDERRDIGRVAGPQHTTDRSTLTFEHSPDDHLLEIRPVILAEATLTDRLSPFDLVARFPLVGGTIAARVEEPVEDGEEDGPLDGELEASSLQQLLDDTLAAGQLPEPLEDQGRADVPDRDGREPALGMLGEQRTDRAKRAPEASRASSWPLTWS